MSTTPAPEMPSSRDVKLEHGVPTPPVFIDAGASGAGEYLTLHVDVPAVFGAARPIAADEVRVTGAGTSSIEVLHVELLAADTPEPATRRYAIELRRVEGPGGGVTVRIPANLVAGGETQDAMAYAHHLDLAPWQSARLFELAAEGDAVTVDLPDHLLLPERGHFRSTTPGVEVCAAARTVTFSGLQTNDDHYAYIEIHDAVGTVVGTIELFVYHADRG